MENQKKSYNKRTWLNKENSPSCGSVVAFDGESLWKGKKISNTFLSVSDCCVSVRLVKTEDDTVGDFVDKMELLKTEIELFINHLKQAK